MLFKGGKYDLANQQIDCSGRGPNLIPITQVSQLTTTCNCRSTDNHCRCPLLASVSTSIYILSPPYKHTDIQAHRLAHAHEQYVTL